MKDRSKQVHFDLDTALKSKWIWPVVVSKLVQQSLTIPGDIESSLRSGQT